MDLGDRSGETASTSMGCKRKGKECQQDIAGGHEPNWKKKKKSSGCEMFGGCFLSVDFGI